MYSAMETNFHSFIAHLKGGTTQVASTNMIWLSNAPNQTVRDFYWCGSYILNSLVAICWERAVPLAFHLCCFYFSAVVIVCVPFTFVFRAGCGIRLYRYLIIAFLSSF